MKSKPYVFATLLIEHRQVSLPALRQLTPAAITIALGLLTAFLACFL